VEDCYDLTASLFSAKANEGMIAFAGFLAAEGPSVSEGVLKIAAFRRPDHDGYLTLTFVIDLEADSGLKGTWQRAFSRATQSALAERLGPDFEMLLEVPLNPFAESPRFFVEELNLYFRRLAGRERWLLEEHVIPTLADLIGLRIEALEWLDAPGQAMPSPEAGRPGRPSESPLRQHVKRQLDDVSQGLSGNPRNPKDPET
jgi:hypothetical protein